MEGAGSYLPLQIESDIMATVEEWLGPGLFKALGSYLEDELGVEEVDDLRMVEAEHLAVVRGMLKPVPLKKFNAKYDALFGGHQIDHLQCVIYFPGLGGLVGAGAKYGWRSAAPSSATYHTASQLGRRSSNC